MTNSRNKGASFEREIANELTTRLELKHQLVMTNMILTADLTCTAGSAGRGIIKAATGDRNSQSCSELHPELQRSDEH